MPRHILNDLFQIVGIGTQANKILNVL